MKTEAKFLSGFIGTSMLPTLDKTDLLEVHSYRERAPREGDVIYFVPAGEREPVVHRVVCCSFDGIRTRGDNSSADDSWVLQPGDIEGRVVAAWRRSKRRRIYGGLWGWSLACFMGLGHALLGKVKKLPLFRVLSAARISLFKPRIVAFAVNGRAYPKLFWRRWMVGQYDPERREWRVKAPFRLFASSVTSDIDSNRSL